MARLAVYQNLSIHMKELAELFMYTFDGTTPVMRMPDEAAYQFGNDFVSVYGELYYTNGQLTSGTISRIEIFPASGSWVEMSKLFLDVETVLAAVNADSSGANSSAVEDLVYGLDWIIIGRPTQEYFGGNEVNSELQPISFRGNDYVRLEGGQDIFHAGDGNDVVFGNGEDDTIYGGRGNDTISGGHNRDTLEGGEGHDVLNGDRGRDRILGGKGADTLDGGMGHDYLRGGRASDLLIDGMGNDYLLGGTEADIFRFKETDMSGWFDRIVDFEIGLDQVQIDVTGSPSYTISEVAGDTRISLNGGTITIENVTQTEFESIADHLLFI